MSIFFSQSPETVGRQMKWKLWWISSLRPFLQSSAPPSSPAVRTAPRTHLPPSKIHKLYKNPNQRRNRLIILIVEVRLITFLPLANQFQSGIWAHGRRAWAPHGKIRFAEPSNWKPQTAVEERRRGNRQCGGDSSAAEGNEEYCVCYND